MPMLEQYHVAYFGMTGVPSVAGLAPSEKALINNCYKQVALCDKNRFFSEFCIAYRQRKHVILS